MVVFRVFYGFLKVRLHWVNSSPEGTGPEGQDQQGLCIKKNNPPPILIYFNLKKGPSIDIWLKVLDTLSLYKQTSQDLTKKNLITGRRDILGVSKNYSPFPH